MQVNAGKAEVIIRLGLIVMQHVMALCEMFPFLGPEKQPTDQPLAEHSAKTPVRY